MKSLFLSFLFLVIIILIGILADIVGTAVAAAEESPFHAKAAKRVRGAREGVYLIRNADRVANICNDVIGDIAGTVSGALGIALVLQILLYWKGINQALLNMMVTALIAAFTVGGKAAGKRIAISRANEVIFLVGKLLAAFEQLTGIRVIRKKYRRAGK
ncbi:Mg2+/Co2+ transporter CorB [Desulfofundulus luciae]|uniref:Mg2+/Co2+ transporter CorB n=1 Tax=Desulfofundulus luciae TaxID=74702 RepID=A0ABU0B1G9_9FIRM|nr:Mg2+/Co2+ transporter CorB [Desulfofundulus luciae]